MATPEMPSIRSTALMLACKTVTPESPTGHYLSTARQFERYIASGVSQTGAGGRSGVQMHVDNFLIRLDGPDLTDELVARMEKVAREVLGS